MRSLTIQRILVAVYVTAASYCALSAIAGPAGLISYGRLEKRRADMEGNLEALKANNASLQTELASLQSDPDRLGREARALGFLAKDETSLILPQGDGAAAPKKFEAGRVLPYAAPPALSDESIKTISFALGLASLICALAADLRRSPARKPLVSHPLQR
jgi:cell division protein FtsB